MVKTQESKKQVATATPTKKKEQQVVDAAAAATAAAAAVTVAAVKEEVKEEVKGVVESGVADEHGSVVDGLVEVLSVITTLETQLRSLKATVKTLQKDHAKEVKLLSKQKGRKKATGGDKANRKPSGFAKPTRISGELSSFLKLNKDAMIARTEATKLINAYIKQHNLQNPENRKEIKPDTQLKKLLGPLEQGDVAYTYFNLQRYMKNHFVKEEVPAQAQA